MTECLTIFSRSSPASLVTMSNMLPYTSTSLLLGVGHSVAVVSMRNLAWLLIQNWRGLLVMMARLVKIVQPSFVSFCLIPYSWI